MERNQTPQDDFGRRSPRIRPGAPMNPRVKNISFLLTTALILVVAGNLLLRLYNLQIVQGADLRARASRQQLLDSTIQATRGEIYDATGKTLASTNIVWDIGCDPSYSTALYSTVEVQQPNEKGELETVNVRRLNEAACAEISRQMALRILSKDGMSLDAVNTAGEEYQKLYQELYGKLSQIDSQYKTLATKVNNAVKDSLLDYAAEYRRQEKERGNKNGRISLTTSKSYLRDYPYGAFAAAVLGFCDQDGHGFYGLERSYESTLAGVNGRKITRRNAYGDEIANDGAVTHEAKDGSNLVLSLDANVQEVVERYLTEAVIANNVENRGCAIVMNVKDGSILAMSSKPDFDPNNPTAIYDAAYMEEIVRAEPELYAVYERDEKGNVVRDSYGNKVLKAGVDYSGTYRDIQWKNKTITELYYPGSVFKVITAAMGVDSGVMNYNTEFNCAGAYNVDDRTYHCAGRKAHGVQNLAVGLMNSCNIYFIQMGQHIGSAQFFEYFKAFGFTERTGVDLPNETGFMQYYNEKSLGSVQLASSSFGQAMAITPLQTCTAIAACVNGGYLVTPHVVKQITDRNGNVIEEIGAGIRRQVISKNASETIRQILEYEVGDGHNTTGGYNAYVAGYRIGGKSGTSEQLNMNKRLYDNDYKKVASFVAVLPADDPEILVYVMLDDPNNAKTDYSSILAAPVVGNIISEIAPYLGIAKDGIDRSGEILRVPYLLGKEWSNAQVSLNIMGLNHSLVESETSNAGKTVTYQYPAAGMQVSSGTTVYLYTDSYTGSHVTVPNVEGKTVSFARQILSAAGLNCVAEGDPNGVAVAQSSASGASVQRGTIVTVTFAGASPEPPPETAAEGEPSAQ